MAEKAFFTKKRGEVLIFIGVLSLQRFCVVSVGIF